MGTFSICFICKKKFYGRWYNQHIKMAHKITIEQYYSIKHPNIKKYCSNENCKKSLTFKNIIVGYGSTCGSRFCISSIAGKIGGKVVQKIYPHLAKNLGKKYGPINGKIFGFKVLHKKYPELAINGGKRLKQYVIDHPDHQKESFNKLITKYPNHQKDSFAKLLQKKPNHQKVAAKRSQELFPNAHRNFEIALKKDPTIRHRAGINSVIKQLNNRGPNNLEKDFEFLTKIKFNKTKYIVFKTGKHKLPDFIVGTKVIELHGNFWHKDEDTSKIINLYKEVGYDCLVIWESDWKQNKLHWIEKVKEFIL